MSIFLDCRKPKNFQLHFLETGAAEVIGQIAAGAMMFYIEKDLLKLAVDLASETGLKDFLKTDQLWRLPFPVTWFEFSGASLMFASNNHNNTVDSTSLNREACVFVSIESYTRLVQKIGADEPAVKAFTNEIAAKMINSRPFEFFGQVLCQFTDKRYKKSDVVVSPMTWFLTPSRVDHDYPIDDIDNRFRNVMAEGHLFCTEKCAEKYTPEWDKQISLKLYLSLLALLNSPKLIAARPYYQAGKKRKKTTELIPGEPQYLHKVVSLSVEAKNIFYQGTPGAAVEKMAHIVRGHFKIRETGIYWWKAHIRGDRSKGFVDKDYDVYATEETRRRGDRRQQS